MVVHREPEQDGEEEERQPRLDRLDLREAEELVADALLEDEHDQTVGRSHREQVEHDRLRRHDERAERDRQQHEAEAEHVEEDDRKPAIQHLAVVDDLGGLAGDEDFQVGAGQRLRHDLGAEPLDRLYRRLVPAVTADLRLDDRQLAVGRPRHRRSAERRVVREPLRKVVDRGPRLARVDVALQDDLRRVDGPDAELALERVEAVLRGVAVRDRPARRPSRCGDRAPAAPARPATQPRRSG